MFQGCQILRRRPQKKILLLKNITYPTCLFLFIKGDPVGPESLLGLPNAEEMGATVQAMGLHIAGLT